VAAVRDTLLKDAQLAGSAARLRRRSVMSRRTSQILALTILLPATISGSPGHAQENFKLLGEKEIRARVVGKDITDSSIGRIISGPMARFSAAKWVENAGKSRTTNSACRTQTWSRPIATKSGCPALT